jgi:type IV pilus assembly protein PilV
MLKSSRWFAESGAPRARLMGFSLVEVLVALVVLGVGLLGIAKLQGAAYSNTATAARRSLAALEADSLAASMHVNRGYWSKSADPAGATITVQGSTVTVASGAGANLNTAVAANPSCTSTTTPCTVENMAAYDLIRWALALQAIQLPNYTATVACGTGTPISCTITTTWSENAVAVNSTEASAAASAAAASTAPSSTVNAFQYPTYTLYVQP